MVLLDICGSLQGREGSTRRKSLSLNSLRRFKYKSGLPSRHVYCHVEYYATYIATYVVTDIDTSPSDVSCPCNMVSKPISTIVRIYKGGRYAPSLSRSAAA